MERKDFIKKITVGGSVLLAAPLIFSSCNDGNDEVINDMSNNNSEITLDLTNSKYTNLQTIGGFIYVNEIIVVRLTETQYIALSSICTHQACTVEYASSDTAIVCPCHGSRYTTSGVVTQGPAPTNLKKYSVKVSGNTLTIK